MIVIYTNSHMPKTVTRKVPITGPLSLVSDYIAPITKKVNVPWIFDAGKSVYVHPDNLQVVENELTAAGCEYKVIHVGEEWSSNALSVVQNLPEKS